MPKRRIAAPVSDVCPRCLIAFPHHLVVRARCAKRWRGANFDQAAAEGNVGAALASLWNIDVRAKDGVERLLRKALVRSFGERREVNPTQRYDPAEGEDFEFHIGLREAAAPADVERVRAAVVDAIRGSRNFSAQDP
jgi:hypothetical protein